MWPFLAGLYGRHLVGRHGIRKVERVFWGLVLWFIGLFLWTFLCGLVLLPAAWVPTALPWCLCAYWVVSACVVAKRWGE